MAELTPMMKQYMETKSQYQDCILFYRLGDFYEMFFEDAKIASKELGCPDCIKGVGNHFNREKLRAGRKGAYVRSSVSCRRRIFKQTCCQRL